MTSTSEVEAAVARQQVQHVVEEADARLAGPSALAVEAERQADVGLLGLAGDLGGARHPVGFSRTRIDSACRVKPSASAIGAPARASASAAPLIRTTLMRRRNCRVDSPDVNRAAPPVGSVWLEPAT